MSALGHYLERAGIPTVSISLIREHSAAIRPPRALWVPFELGRPLGAPNEPGFQRRVLLAALRLLEAPAGPVLADFPDDAPGAGGGEAAWVCPVSFAPPNGGKETTLAEAVMAEVRSLEPWHAAGVARRGRSTVGIAGLPIDRIVTLLAQYAESGRVEAARDGIDFPTRIKYALDDLLAFYLEAAAAQPGSRPGSRELRTWFWSTTRAADLFRAVRDRARTGEDRQLRFIVSSLLVPRGVQE